MAYLTCSWTVVFSALCVCGAACAAPPGNPAEIAASAEGKSAQVDQTENQSQQQSVGGRVVPFDLVVPRAARPGEMPILEITVRAPQRSVIEVADKEGKVLGVIRPFGIDLVTTQTISLPDVPAGSGELHLVARLKSSQKPGDLVVEEAKLDYLAASAAPGRQ